MVVLTPVVASLLFGEHVTRTTWGGVAFATLGMAVLSLDRVSVSAGAFLTLLGAMLFAFHIASLGAWASPQDALGLTAVQVVVTTTICGFTAALLGELEAPQDSAAWSAVIYLAAAATCMGFGVQTWSQSRLKATRAALIMTLEPVFGGLFAIGFGGEALTWRTAVGGAIIVTAMLIVELAARRGAEAMLPRIECC
jgi:drug/metabolite transporter (DMT)-like permease